MVRGRGSAPPPLKTVFSLVGQAGRPAREGAWPGAHAMAGTLPCSFCRIMSSAGQPRGGRGRGSVNIRGTLWGSKPAHSQPGWPGAAATHAAQSALSRLTGKQASKHTGTRQQAALPTSGEVRLLAEGSPPKVLAVAVRQPIQQPKLGLPVQVGHRLRAGGQAGRRPVGARGGK